MTIDQVLTATVRAMVINDTEQRTLHPVRWGRRRELWGQQLAYSRTVTLALDLDHVDDVMWIVGDCDRGIGWTVDDLPTVLAKLIDLGRQRTDSNDLQ